MQICLLFGQVMGLLENLFRLAYDTSIFHFELKLRNFVPEPFQYVRSIQHAIDMLPHQSAGIAAGRGLAENTSRPGGYLSICQFGMEQVDPVR
jgi:hypothetical protein